jgi:uncharacterized Fe-S cluster-containing protein
VPDVGKLENLVVEPLKKISGTYENVPKMAMCQNLVPLVIIKIAGKWMFIPLKMVLIGIDPNPNVEILEKC